MTKMLFRISRGAFCVPALLLLVAAPLLAQVFPDEEYVDVLRLSDGSILRGVITEEEPERYVAIEIYGGSRFVVSTANIVSRSRERNIDYGTKYLRIDLGDLEFPSDRNPGGDDAVGGASPVEDASSGDNAGRWPDPNWIRPVTLGVGTGGPTDDVDFYSQLGGARAIGDFLYVGAIVHVFFLDPIPYPLGLVGYGDEAGRFLVTTSFLPMGSSFVAQLGITVRRVRIAGYTAIDYGGGFFGGGVSLGYLF